MSALKTEIRKAVLDDLVASLEDQKGAAEVSSIELRGGKVVVEACIQVVAAAMTNVKSQFDSGDLSLEEAQLVRRFLNSTVGSMAGIAKTAHTRSAEKAGEAKGLETTLSIIRKQSDICQKKLDEEAINPTPEREAPRSLREQRNAETVAKSAEVSDQALTEFAEEEGIVDLSSQIEELIEAEHAPDTR